MRFAAWSQIGEEPVLPPIPELEAHLAPLRNPGARKSSAAAWALLYRLMAGQGIEPGELFFEEGGKPRFRGDPIWFSISHSGGICAVSVADVPTGVDVEHVRASYRQSLLQRSISPQERSVFDGDFTALWCRKEAISKLTGRGITGWPASIDTLDKRYSFCERSFESGGMEYRLAAVFQGENEPVKTMFISI